MDPTHVHPCSDRGTYAADGLTAKRTCSIPHPSLFAHVLQSARRSSFRSGELGRTLLQPIHHPVVHRWTQLTLYSVLMALKFYIFFLPFLYRFQFYYFHSFPSTFSYLTRFLPYYRPSYQLIIIINLLHIVSGVSTHSLTLSFLLCNLRHRAFAEHLG